MWGHVGASEEGRGGAGGGSEGDAVCRMQLRHVEEVVGLKHLSLLTAGGGSAGHSELLMLAADRETSLTKTCSAIRSRSLVNTGLEFPFRSPSGHSQSGLLSALAYQVCKHRLRQRLLQLSASVDASLAELIPAQLEIFVKTEVFSPWPHRLAMWET